MDTPDLLIGVAAIPVLLLVSAAFVAAEIAMVTVRQTELDELVKSGRPAAVAARAVTQRLDHALAAIQVGITSIGLLLGWFAESNLADALRPLVAGALPAWHGAVAHVLSGAVIITLLTGLQVILGELVPKAIALQHPRAVALLLARPLLLFSRAFAPVVWVLNAGAALVLRLLGFRRAQALARAHSVHELGLLVDQTREAGALRPEQAVVVQNVFRLSGKTARDIMVPFERVAMLDARWPAERILDSLESGAHTRMPVYEGEPTNIVGLVNAKDVFRAWRRAGALQLRDVMRPITFLAPDARIAEQLESFRAHRLHLAIVGARAQPLGIVTLEDIIEEVVGEIEDEHDRPSSPQRAPRGGS